VFLAHAGCPFQCVYCNQRAVASSPSCAALNADVTREFQEQFARLLDHAREQHSPGELAFYGGTFTALPVEALKKILETVTPWVCAGVFSGLRFSTRPDSMTEGACSLLAPYPIETVELGVQSLVDEVLMQSRRGYAVESVKKAVELVRRQGWQLGLQLMLGLPGDSPAHFLDSVAQAVELRPDFVRIYPTLVLTGTALAEWYRQGTYTPLSLEEAVSWCTPAYEALFRAQIPIARLGLQPDPQLQKPGRVIAGPFHPAFGYLVRVEWWKERLDRHLEVHQRQTRGKAITLWVADGALSEVIGPARSNIRHWLEKWLFSEVKVQGRATQLPGEFDYSLN
jgi:histone acetyltransferase (RNA polymerase elongator complex component)